MVRGVRISSEGNTARGRPIANPRIGPQPASIPRHDTRTGCTGDGGGRAGLCLIAERQGSGDGADHVFRGPAGAAPEWGAGGGVVRQAVGGVWCRCLAE